MQTPLCDMFGIEYPIFAFTHCRDVVAAVTKQRRIGHHETAVGLRLRPDGQVAIRFLLDGVRHKPPKGEMVIVVQGTGARTSSRDSRHGEIDPSTSETA